MKRLITIAAIMLTTLILGMTAGCSDPSVTVQDQGMDDVKTDVNVPSDTTTDHGQHDTGSDITEPDSINDTGTPEDAVDTHEAQEPDTIEDVADVEPDTLTDTEGELPLDITEDQNSEDSNELPDGCNEDFCDTTPEDLPQTDTDSAPDVQDDHGNDSGSANDNSQEDPGTPLDDTVDVTMPDTGEDTEITVTTVSSATPMAAIENTEFPVAITGSNLLAVTAVRLVGDSALNQDYLAEASAIEPSLDGTQLLATFPASNALIRGYYRLEVINGSTVLDSLSGFSILAQSAQAPLVESVSPDSAKSGRNRMVIIEGTGFKPGASVRLAGAGVAYESSYVEVSDGLTLTAVIEAGTQDIPVGDYALWVLNPDGLAGRWGEMFSITDQAPPTILGISPARAGNASEVTLVVSGVDFVEGAWVSLASEAGDLVLPTSVLTEGTELEAVIPAGITSGIYPVRVTNPDQQYDTYYFYQVSNNSPGSLTTFEIMAEELNTPRWQHGLDAMTDGAGHGFLLVTGGLDSNGIPLDEIEISQVSPNGKPGRWKLPEQTDPLTGNRILNRLNEPRSGAATVRVGKTLFVIGGRTLPDALSPATDTMETARILSPSGAPRLRTPVPAGNGMLPEGRWLYRVSAVTPDGETLASSSVAYRGNAGSLSIAWEPVKKAVGYNIFRCPAANCIYGDEAALVWMSDPATRQFTDTGYGVLTPSPSRLDAAVIPDDPDSLTGNTYSYAVTSVVEIEGLETFESIPGRPLNVFVPGGTGMVSLVFDDVAASDGYRIYRSEDSGPYYLIAELDTGTTSWDDSLQTAMSGFTAPIATKPLPTGSLSLFSYPVDASEDSLLLNMAREGAQASYVEMSGYDPTLPESITGVIVILGGRASFGPLPESIATVETIPLHADGTMGQPEIETVEMITGRSFFGLGNSQQRMENLTFDDDDDDDPVDPDCEDRDLDGFFDAACGGTDCDDYNPAVNPAAWEDLQNGIDDNCDGLVDVPTTGWGGRSGDFVARAPRESGGVVEPVFLLALFGNSDVLATSDTGRRDIEAVGVNLTDGHLLDLTDTQTGTFRLQANSDNGDVHGLNIALYQNFLFSFMGTGSENLGQVPSTLKSQSKRFPFCPPPAPGDPGDASFGCPGYTAWTESDLAGNKRTSANATVSGGLGYYGLTRAFGYIYLVGGAGAAGVSSKTHRVLQ